MGSGTTCTWHLEWNLKLRREIFLVFFNIVFISLKCGMHSSNVRNVANAEDQTDVCTDVFLVLIVPISNMPNRFCCCQRDCLRSIQRSENALVRMLSARHRQRNILLNIFDITLDFRSPPGYGACSMRDAPATEWLMFFLAASLTLIESGASCTLSADGFTCSLLTLTLGRTWV